MVHDDGIINQSKPVMLNNEEKLDRISHTLVFYVNGKEVCNYIYCIVNMYCYTYYVLDNTFKYIIHYACM